MLQFGEKLKMTRLHRQVSLEELSQSCLLDPLYLKRLENGELLPSHEDILALSEAPCLALKLSTLTSWLNLGNNTLRDIQDMFEVLGITSNEDFMVLLRTMYPNPPERLAIIQALLADQPKGP